MKTPKRGEYRIKTNSLHAQEGTDINRQEKKERKKYSQAEEYRGRGL